MPDDARAGKLRIAQPQIAQTLADLAELDERCFLHPGPLPPHADSLRRQALIEKLAYACRNDPAALLPYAPLLGELADRSTAIEARWRIQRIAIAKSMIEELEEAETQLRQLRSFQQPAAADASLLNRLA